MPLKEFKAKLVPEIKELNFFLKKNLLSSSLTGELMSSLKGRGIEFEDYRDYTVEDDASRIDWIASKRSQRTLVREYKLEVNFKVLLLIDVSESMLFSSTKKLKCEYAAEVACSLLYGLLQVGNAVGYGFFNDGISKMVMPKMDKKQFYNFTKEISNPKNYGNKKNFNKAIEQSLRLIDKKSLFIIISDYIFQDNSWVDFFKILATKNEILGIMIRDQREYEIPDVGQIIIEDPFSKEKLYIDTKQYSKAYKEYNEKQLKFIRSIFTSNRANLMELPTNEHYIHNMLEFFRKSGARWR